MFYAVSVPFFRPPTPPEAEMRPGLGCLGFAALHARADATPLTEILPATATDRTAALGFALAWACAAGPEHFLLWSAPEAVRGEDGALYAEGLSQFGTPLERLLLARTRTQEEALWAAEQGLRTPGTLVLCAIAPASKPLSLTVTRRLLLAAETHKTRCVLLRFDQAGVSASWTRWVVSAAPSQGARRELGPPRFCVRLARNRAGPCGQTWLLEWNAHEHLLRSVEATLDGAVAAAPADRPADAHQRRVG